jgi:diguanylate cyclase (GGDEF)-like protein
MEGGAPVLSDMGSTNGTYINGKRVSRHNLQNGDKIQISSSTIIKFGLGDEGERLFHDEFYNMANMDAATGVYNKQFFLKRLEEEFAYAKRQGGNMSLVMCDIDFFKKVNDTHGHMAGDFVLQQVAAALKETVRSEDVLARYGGEEFIIILRQIDEEGAFLLGERIRARVAEKAMEFEGTKIPVTMSFGLASVEDTSIESAEALIAAADEFLYMSKEGGRNRVTSAHHKP